MDIGTIETIVGLALFCYICGLVLGIIKFNK